MLYTLGKSTALYGHQKWACHCLEPIHISMTGCSCVQWHTNVTYLQYKNHAVCRNLTLQTTVSKECVRETPANVQRGCLPPILRSLCPVMV